MFELPTVDYPVDDLSGLPEGFRLRPYAGESDIPAIVNIVNRALEHDGVPFRTSVPDLTARHRHPSEMFDAARDVTIAEVDGEPVAYSDRSWVDTTLESFREYRVDGAVLPEWLRRGIGTALLAENERLSRELATTHSTDRPRIFGSWTSDRQEGAHALLRRAGFQQVRWFFEMTRPLNEPIPDIPLPDGIEVRPVTPEMVRQIWHADVEAFQDHWGGFDSSDQSFKRWLEEPSFDPSLWVIAYDGDEVAGGVVNGIDAEENAALGVKRAWLQSVFTRRQWRRRGLAKALIARSLVAIRERGLDTGILGVDADNPSGALGLYEGIGFGVAERSTAWRKPFEL
ncbi:MAG: GNAT family N-acetyltransferase [Chloroflexota bacterium]